MSKQIIFTANVKICTGLYCFNIPRGTIANCQRMLAIDAAEVTAKDIHGEQISFIQIFIGAKFSDCQFWNTCEHCGNGFIPSYGEHARCADCTKTPDGV